MYIPVHFAAADATVARLLAHPSAADLVTATAEGLADRLVAGQD